jgi:hypothetical protein
MMSRWGLEGMGSFEHARLAQKEEPFRSEESKQPSETVS